MYQCVNFKWFFFLYFAFQSEFLALLVLEKSLKMCTEINANQDGEIMQIFSSSSF